MILELWMEVSIARQYGACELAHHSHFSLSNASHQCITTRVIGQ
jgi:hypothetical protein